MVGTVVLVVKFVVGLVLYPPEKSNVVPVPAKIDSVPVCEFTKAETPVT